LDVRVVGDHQKRTFNDKKVQAVIDTIIDHQNLGASQRTGRGR